MFSRRNFITRAAGAVAGSILPAWARDDRQIRTVSIFHTTDLHGNVLPTSTYDGIADVGGLARCATQIKQWQKASPHNLLIDVGDVYQGTIAGYQSQGSMMIELFNKLNYDAWVMGNHEFDWGLDVVADAAQRSNMPIITGNVTLDGKPSGKIDSAPFANVKPWIIKNVGGFRIGIIGLITPGLPYWLRPELLKELSVFAPVESLKQSVAELQSEKVDAIVVAGHMGWKTKDDFANPLRDMIKQVPGVDLYLGGHTHQDKPVWFMENTFCTQSNYFGIHCGRVDLTFDRESRKLLDRRAWTVLMDDRIALDPIVIDTARPHLEKADQRRAEVIGHIPERISAKGSASPFWAMLCKAFLAAAAKEGMPADGVFHGTFGTPDVMPGVKTIADAWTWIPYDNWLVNAEFTGEQLNAIIAEANKFNYSDRALYGIEQSAIEPTKTYRILINSYDGQSGGRRLMTLRQIISSPSTKSTQLKVNSRDALITWLTENYPAKNDD